MWSEEKTHPLFLEHETYIVRGTPRHWTQTMVRDSASLSASTVREAAEEAETPTLNRPHLSELHQLFLDQRHQHALCHIHLFHFFARSFLQLFCLSLPLSQSPRCFPHQLPSLPPG